VNDNGWAGPRRNLGTIPAQNVVAPREAPGRDEARVPALHWHCPRCDVTGWDGYTGWHHHWTATHVRGAARVPLTVRVKP